MEKRKRLANKYTSVSVHDCDLTNEWWEQFKNLSPKKLEKAKAIIALNKFKPGDYKTKDKAVLNVLKYYQITRNDAEG